MKVSICIPAYEQPDYLRICLDSILKQDYKNYEVIITDDSSDDSVSKLLQTYDTTLNISYHKNKLRKGTPQNWNEAIDKASGEYIKIMHHDDWFTQENSLSEFVRMLDEDPNVNFAYSAALVWNADTKTETLHCPSEEEIYRIRRNYKRLLPINSIGAPSATIYRRKVNKHFDINLKWVVDLDFYLSILSENGRFVFCNKPLIATTNAAPHQVTNECLNNKEMELFEWFYLYSKHLHGGLSGYAQHSFPIKVITKA